MSGEQMISTGLQDELIRLDENSLHTRYKFGVLLVKENQTKEEEWFSNENDSSAFNEFLDIIGRKIELKGYSGWAAGLDTKSGDSGEFCYTNKWNENNLAYHVSTLLPSKAGDKQQIQRKRHIGNDIVCLVFVEGNQPFNPTAIKSQFLHVFIIVHKESWKDTHAWRVEIVSVEDVPPFGPPLPGKSAVFFDKKELESYLVAKLVNAEYAAFKSPKFALPMNRAREGIFTNLVEKGYHMLRTEETEPTEEVKEDTVKKHTKSPSTSSSISTIVSPTPSKSNAIREFSENIVTKNDNSLYCDPQDYQQFLTIRAFDAIVNDYLQNLSSKKRDKALVDNHRYSLILQVLKDPRNTAISTAQFRFWVKKMFRLSTTVDNIEYVCHDDKPVATREDIYFILTRAHKEAHHGGRDKTSALVRKRYSWIPKELIARFVRHCPFCISRRNDTNRPNHPCYSAASISMAATVATSAAVTAVALSFMAPSPPLDNHVDFYYPSESPASDRQDSCSPKPNHLFGSYFDGHSADAAAAAAVVTAAAIAAANSNRLHQDPEPRVTPSPQPKSCYYGKHGLLLSPSPDESNIPSPTDSILNTEF
ncbi:uncharacterized protein B0P05DRAFT_480868 [Gilbertella persicaria]|uniref:uncharacterized protein n=1 Tax=Gilbertella persicaria TaxID=101096 RepID=UPI00222042A1|nr:uncharacterized protein B0P05DRAFT_480868 [Gilbertella persicaria]KAI8048758.1 hypothetical protein B0P05DRAFT_480868 [Gilbertella persicaria]